MIYNYILKDFSGNIVYIGKTNDLKRRGDEHLNEGMIFREIEAIAAFKTDEEACAFEEKAIKNHLKTYGCLPKYNKNVTGK